MLETRLGKIQVIRRPGANGEGAACPIKTMPLETSLDAKPHAGAQFPTTADFPTSRNTRKPALGRLTQPARTMLRPPTASTPSSARHRQESRTTAQTASRSMGGCLPARHESGMKQVIRHLNANGDAARAPMELIRVLAPRVRRFGMILDDDKGKSLPQNQWCRPNAVVTRCWRVLDSVWGRLWAIVRPRQKVQNLNTKLQSPNVLAWIRARRQSARIEARTQLGLGRRDGGGVLLVVVDIGLEGRQRADSMRGDTCESMVREVKCNEATTTHLVDRGRTDARRVSRVRARRG
uniref:Uncharacterized protein n=1 Tax=Mycena chlorophos TaxID=658473 RepID=A0ABQ0KY58_MYCCL|nr:predicted protein [Mycena chlorophos]